MGFIFLLCCGDSEPQLEPVTAVAETAHSESEQAGRTLMNPDNTPVVLPPSPPNPDDISRSVNWEAYPFLNTTEGVQSLQAAFDVPQGYQRVPVAEGGFGAWLRTLPILKRKQVYSYRGEIIRNAPAVAVVPMSVGRGDIQQCADSILRLYGEYLWAKAAVEDWGIHFTSGDLSAWKDWRSGQRFQVEGASVTPIQTATTDDSYEQYQKWMHHAFIYAGTQSLHHDAQEVSLNEAVSPGDFFVSPGSPGHAILVLDVAIAEGRPPVALLGQGFMPAQEFHVLTDTADHVQAHWFELPLAKGDYLLNPSYYGIPRTGVFRF